VFVLARKLATLIYRRIRWGAAYVDDGMDAHEERYQQIRIKSLTAKAKAPGFKTDADHSLAPFQASHRSAPPPAVAGLNHRPDRSRSRL
jgi:hypothetical protein